jgi:hypothetical protein
MKDEALRLVLEALENVTEDYVKDRQYKHNKAITAIKEALAQPAQEPDVVMHCNSNTWTINNSPPKGSDDVNLYYAPAAQRKPLSDEEIWSAIRPLTRSDEVCKALVHVSMDEYRALEAAHGITGENT